MKHEITEADVIGFFTAATEKYAPLFPEVEMFSATHGIGCGVGFFGYMHSPKFDIISAYAATFEEAAKKLREKLGTPEAEELEANK